MASIQNIREHMEVLGSDGKHVGRVDCVKGDDRIILSKSDPNSGGRHHAISADWVDHVDRHVHLNKSCYDAMKQWQTV